MHLLESKTSSNRSLKALFDPEKGMNLVSFQWGGLELIDLSTKPLFEERYAGLGALIGPHFHHRADVDIPSIDVKEAFLFTEKILKKQKEPFSHGIARYVPWKYEGDSTQIKAVLKGADTYKGLKLMDLEGQDFELTFRARLSSDGLQIEYSIEAEKPSVIGLHYYYALPQQRAMVSSCVYEKYHHPEGWKSIPKEWLKGKNELNFSLEPSLDIDYGFRPPKEKLGSHILLNTLDYSMAIEYQASQLENAWQLYHPKDATFVCIEPVNAHNPRKATQTSSKLNVNIKVLDEVFSNL